MGRFRKVLVGFGLALTVVCTGIVQAFPSKYETSASQDIRTWGEERVAPNSGMTRPELVTYVSPTYTDEAEQNNVVGVVSFQAEFDIEGNFRILRQLNCLGFGLDESALQALPQWRYLPAYRSGRRVAVISRIDVVLNPHDQIPRLNEIAESFMRRGLRIQIKSSDHPDQVVVARSVKFGNKDGRVPQVTISAVP
jgi:Gram-negative bacterial TonB protein C-terminal